MQDKKDTPLLTMKKRLLDKSIKKKHAESPLNGILKKCSLFGINTEKNGHTQKNAHLDLHDTY